MSLSNVVSALVLAQALNWPSFRGNDASGNGDGQNTPTTWDAVKGVNVLWKTPIEGLGHSSPVIWGEQELWKLSGSSKNTTPTPIAAHDLIYVASGYRIRPIFAIRAGAVGDISLKEGATSNEFVAWSTIRDGPYMSTPIVYGDYFYSVGFNGALTCYDARSGERLYEVRLGDQGGAYSASPVAADGRIYFASEDGDVFVVRAGPKYELMATNPMGELTMATPAISAGRIFVRTVRHLFSIGVPGGGN